MISNALAGYRLAAAHLRQLVAVLLPVVAAALLSLALLDLALGRDRTVIINRLPVTQADHVLARARLAVIAAFWVLGLAAAALTAVGGARGHAIRPASAFLAAARSFPVHAAGAAAVAALTVVALRIVTGGRLDLDRIVAALATGDGPRSVLDAVGPVNRPLFAATLVVAGLVASRLAVALLPHQLGGSHRRPAGGRVPGTVSAFLLGGIAVPLIPVLLSPLVLPVAILLQAGILAHIYLLPRLAADGQAPADLTPADLTPAGLTPAGLTPAGLTPAGLTPAGLTSAGLTADLALADARLAGLGGRPARLPWLAGAATAAVIALLAPAGVAAANPLHAPTVRSHVDAPGSPVAAAWPAGRHPVIATTTGAWFCDNDLCDRNVAVNGGPAVVDGNGAAGISPDGTSVVKAALTGGLDSGGPFLNYARCTRDGCHQAWLPVRASARERFAWPSLAAAVAPDRSLWFAFATPAADDKTFRVTFLRCADVPCPHPARYDAGTVQHIADPASADRQRVHLSIGPDGRPTATIRTGVEAAQLTCCATATPTQPTCCTATTPTQPTCPAAAAPTQPACRTTAAPASLFAGDPGTLWTAAPGRVIAYQPGRLRVGDRLLPLPGNRTASWSGALATSGSAVYATAAEAPENAGSHPSQWQQVVWRCDATSCHRQILDKFPTTYTREVMAVATDGRVFIARPDRILLLSAR